MMIMTLLILRIRNGSSFFLPRANDTIIKTTQWRWRCDIRINVTHPCTSIYSTCFIFSVSKRPFHQSEWQCLKQPKTDDRRQWQWCWRQRYITMMLWNHNGDVMMFHVGKKPVLPQMSFDSMCGCLGMWWWWWHCNMLGLLLSLVWTTIIHVLHCRQRHPI